MDWLKKGEWGYYKRKCLFQLVMVLLCIVAIVVFCLSGYLVTKTMKNAMTVLGIVFSLPLANFAVVLIALLPHRPLSKETYDTWKSSVTRGIFMTELAMTSPTDPTIPAAGVYVHDTKVLLYCNGKVNAEKAKTYVEGMLSAGGYGTVNVSVITEPNTFASRMKKLEANPMEQEETA